jgi:predicted GTPase
MGQRQLFFLITPGHFHFRQIRFPSGSVAEAVRYVAAQLQQQISTALLNRTRTMPSRRRSARQAIAKFLCGTRSGQAPPTFLLFVNRDELSTPHEIFGGSK